MSNQIPYLSPSRRGPPGTVYHWKPSPRLRRLGWTNLKLGEDWDAAIAGALERNRHVEETIAGAGQGSAAGAAQRGPVRPRWRDLVTAYLADPAFIDLAPKSQAEYRSRIRTLTGWALDGELRLDQLDRQMVIDLRNVLVADGRKHRTAAMLRVLRILLGFAQGRGWIAANWASDIDIPEPPARKRILSWQDMERLAARALAMGWPRTAGLIRFAFWTVQREGDLLALTRIPSWRRMNDMSARARSILAAGGDGHVMGFRIQQSKTGAWVDIPLPQALRVEIEAAFAQDRAEQRASGLIFADEGEDRACPDWAFQRRFRAVVEAERMEDVQFRDLRRSGMVYAGELGVEIQFITARSGHALLGQKRTILDTYMPGNSRFAAEGMAIQWARHQERLAAERGEKEEQG